MVCTVTVPPAETGRLLNHININRPVQNPLLDIKAIMSVAQGHKSAGKPGPNAASVIRRSRDDPGQIIIDLILRRLAGAGRSAIRSH